MMSKSWICTLGAVMFLLAGAKDASADCTISATTVAFGLYDVFIVAPTDSTGNVRVNCKGNSKFNVSVTLSQGQNGTYSPRTMQQGGEALSYNLYLDAARTIVWGDGTGGTQAYTAASLPNGSVHLVVYGRIPPGQDVSAGPYTDSVFATINF